MSAGQATDQTAIPTTTSTRAGVRTAKNDRRPGLPTTHHRAEGTPIMPDWPTDDPDQWPTTDPDTGLDCMVRTQSDAVTTLAEYQHQEVAA